MKRLAIAALTATLVAPSAARAAGGYCFMIVDASGRTVRQTTDPPVDLSRPLSSGLAAAGFAPGTHLAFDQRADDCPRVDEATPRAGSRAAPARAGRVPPRARR